MMGRFAVVPAPHPGRRCVSWEGGVVADPVSRAGAVSPYIERARLLIPGQSAPGRTTSFGRHEPEKTAGGGSLLHSKHHGW